ncbi:MAG: hypothetical protein CMH53_05595 [Myxococcales bacterium]|nr:hypothetical protein [Myxococcales bacterium]
MSMYDGHPTLTKSRVALAICVVSWASACSPSWVGQWRGRVDIGPVQSQQVRMTLSAQPVGGESLWTNSEGTEQRYRVCSVKSLNEQLEIRLVAVPKRCADGPGLTLRGELGARVIHGRMIRTKKDIGFFRLWPADSWPKAD